MRQVRIQKRSRLTVALVAVMAASALLSAFQPASADVLQTGHAMTSSVQQGDYRVSVSISERNNGWLCAVVDDMKGTAHRACASGSDVDVADDLAWAFARGTTAWTTEVTGKNRNAKTTYKHGTITVDVTWTAVGELETIVQPHIEICEFELYEGGCGSWVSAYQRRQATWSATITDSEWGTFVIEQSPGWLQQAAV